MQGEIALFIHLGGEKVISVKELIAIFDISIEQTSKISKTFAAFYKKQNKVEKIGEEETKSLVVTTEQIYYSPISSATLKKRANQFITMP